MLTGCIEYYSVLFFLIRERFLPLTLLFDQTQGRLGSVGVVELTFNNSGPGFIKFLQGLPSAGSSQDRLAPIV